MVLLADLPELSFASKEVHLHSKATSLAERIRDFQMEPDGVLARDLTVSRTYRIFSGTRIVLIGHTAQGLQLARST